MLVSLATRWSATAVHSRTLLIWPIEQADNNKSWKIEKIHDTSASHLLTQAKTSYAIKLKQNLKQIYQRILLKRNQKGKSNLFSFVFG